MKKNIHLPVIQQFSRALVCIQMSSILFKSDKTDHFIAFFIQIIKSFKYCNIYYFYLFDKLLLFIKSVMQAAATQKTYKTFFASFFCYI